MFIFRDLMLRLLEQAYNAKDGNEKLHDTLVVYGLATRVLGCHEVDKVKKRNALANRYLQDRLAGVTDVRLNSFIATLIDKDTIIVNQAIESLNDSKEDRSETYNIDIRYIDGAWATEIL